MRTIHIRTLLATAAVVALLIMAYVPSIVTALPRALGY